MQYIENSNKISNFYNSLCKEEKNKLFLFTRTLFFYQYENNFEFLNLNYDGFKTSPFYIYNSYYDCFRIKCNNDYYNKVLLELYISIYRNSFDIFNLINKYIIQSSYHLGDITIDNIKNIVSLYLTDNDIELLFYYFDNIILLNLINKTIRNCNNLPNEWSYIFKELKNINYNLPNYLGLYDYLYLNNINFINDCRYNADKHPIDYNLIFEFHNFYGYDYQNYNDVYYKIYYLFNNIGFSNDCVDDYENEEF